MKIIFEQKNNSNFDNIIDLFKQKFPEEYQPKIEQLKELVKNFIRKTKYTIKFLNVCNTFSGVRTQNQIIICSPNHMANLGDFLYTILHEIRHEQQISDIKMKNPLTNMDLKNFEEFYKEYWEMELDADQYAKNMLTYLVKKTELPLDVIKTHFKLSDFIQRYPQQSSFVKNMMQRFYDEIQEMRKKGISVNDIQDHPSINQFLDKLEELI